MNDELSWSVTIKSHPYYYLLSRFSRSFLRIFFCILGTQIPTDEVGRGFICCQDVVKIVVLASPSAFCVLSSHCALSWEHPTCEEIMRKPLYHCSGSSSLKKELSTALRDSKLKQTNAERGARKQRERFQYQTGLDFVYWQQSEVFTFLSQEGSQSLSQFWRNGSFFFFKWEWKGLFVMELTKFCAVATVRGSFISFHQGRVPRRALNLFATFFIPSKLVASKI